MYSMTLAFVWVDHTQSKNDQIKERRVYFKVDFGSCM